MKIAGIIAEYNPFHSGHGWQIEETRRRGASHVVVAMSGCFVQRGEPALWDKWVRAEAALLGGADLVLELPLPYATATAQRFAFGGVSLLHGLGGVQLLSFGSECGDIDCLDTAARAVIDPEVEALVPDILAQGMTYAVARQRAVEVVYGGAVSSLLAQPNNILGIEYMAWLKKLGSGIAPMTVQRQGAAHDSRTLMLHASASALRQLVQSEQGIAQAVRYLPHGCRELYLHSWEAGCCADAALLERPMLARLRQLTLAELAALPDISEGLEHRIYDAIHSCTTITALLEKAKTKRYSHARLRRILLSGWLGVSAGLTTQPPPYIRLLAMNSRGREILGAVGSRSTLPISQSMARVAELGERARRFAELEARADDLYGVVTRQVQPCGKDYTKSIIIRK